VLDFLEENEGWIFSLNLFGQNLKSWLAKLIIAYFVKIILVNVENKTSTKLISLGFFGKFIVPLTGFQTAYGFVLNWRRTIGWLKASQWKSADGELN
jgi:hypothetical protein